MQVGTIFGWLDLEHRTVKLQQHGEDKSEVYNLDDLFALVKTMMDLDLAESQRKLDYEKHQEG